MNKDYAKKKLEAYVEHSEYVGDSGVTFLSVRPQTSS